MGVIERRTVLPSRVISDQGGRNACGWDWQTTSGFDEATSQGTLRSHQRRMTTGGVVGEAFGRCSARPNGCGIGSDGLNRR